jgi:hypothetical protein
MRIDAGEEPLPQNNIMSTNFSRRPVQRLAALAAGVSGGGYRQHVDEQEGKHRSEPDF